MLRTIASLRSYFSFAKYKYYRYAVLRCSSSKSPDVLNSFKKKLSEGPSFQHFVSNDDSNTSINEIFDHPPYIQQDLNKSRKVFIETYGCQMNVSDTEIVYSILKGAGFEIASVVNEADVIFVMTCAIREGAEQKVWNRLKYYRSLKRTHHSISQHPLRIGVLGCMAERLKHKLLEKEKIVDIVAGPDSYKDLPNLLSLADEGQKAVNVMLSVDETYADIMPVRVNESSKSAFVSIMRGCDNMCTYCIVPFTRGRERSRPITSILDEVRYLSDQGIKEVTLLGQNVNSYRDLSNASAKTSQTVLSTGFNTIYRSKSGGSRFAELLDKVSDVNPEMRVRFTSPHPKDFPDDVLHVIQDKPNICKLLHMPAQSGSDVVLDRMGRGHTREAYLKLISRIRSIIPEVAFTSDFICGFCDETEDDHRDTLSLLELVKYEFVYVFAYSMRQKTKAHYDLNDNVPEDIKKRRSEEVHSIFRSLALDLHKKEIGKVHLIQVLGPSKRSEFEWSGRNDWNTKIIYPQIPIPDASDPVSLKVPSPGDYITVKVTDCSSQVLKGEPLYHIKLQEFHRKQSKKSFIVN